MGTAPRLEVAWRKRGIAQPKRYQAWLALVGSAHGLLVVFGTDWLGWGELILVTFPPDFLVGFVIASAWIVGWILRGHIASVRGRAVPGLAVVASLAGAWVSCSLMSVFAGLFAMLEGEWLPAIGMILFSWGAGGAFAAMGGVPFFPLSFVATWLAILALRNAAGGVIELGPERIPHRA